MHLFQTIHSEFQRMSKRTLLLIGVLTCITAGLLYAALVEKTPTPKAAPQAAMQKVSLAHTTLSLSQASSLSQSTKTIILTANPQGNKVNGVQVELAYDPTTITILSVTPGTFFQHPVVLFHTIDKLDGRLSYVVAPGLSDSLATQSGIVATITLTVNPEATASTTLHFLPKTKVTQDGTLESVLKNAQDLTLTFPKPTFTPVHENWFPATQSAK